MKIVLKLFFTNCFLISNIINDLITCFNVSINSSIIIKHWKSLIISVSHLSLYTNWPRGTSKIYWAVLNGINLGHLKSRMSLWSVITAGGYRSVTEAVLQHVAAVIRDKGAAEQELLCSLRELKHTVCLIPTLSHKMIWIFFSRYQ